MSHLNEGKGWCQGTARLLIKPVRAVIELGAAGDVLNAALRTVHHANRHGSVEDFIAVALPTMRMGREAMLPGHDLELIGSEASLTAVLALDGIATLKRRGMLVPAELTEVFIEPGMVGAAYIRDRTVEKRSLGWLRRTEARAARRGKTLEAGIKRQDDGTAALVLHHGEATLHIREVVGPYRNDPLMVSTYGLSGPAAPMILPVFPESARGEVDAA